MPFSKNAMLRYRVIDYCLRIPGRLWSLEQLQDECNRALRDYTGVEVSLRTIQADIQFMRSAPPGFCAPIVVRHNKYYEYADPGYSIFGKWAVPLREE